ncbi:ABATE domain-containing protein [Amycolatopsis sp. FBCC-B4732]|uniref:CGNR zinc finger domain-containing protein n=1 Tax=Amycolatopsis sp. FBCC-B4732 TaxID=3079339 RepID=UPI001FF20748|nr:ABATE domain-containing protein [Amycolatopsis sp. FBCC-B4732]UOX91164.1 ABATE domain-containing protein [Amycolatopsis sp. FBCC-B4732]
MEHTFPCGHLALDFAGTLKARRTAVPREALRTPRDLDAWFTGSGVADRAPGCGPADLAAAVALREAGYALVRARLLGEPGPTAAIGVLNAAAARPPAVPRLGRRGRTVSATPEQALSTVARAAVDLLGGPEAELLRECGRPECTQVYLDTSRGARREWCAMATCGNKMKALAHRARQRGNPPLSPARLGA